jgi:hypothetical protein
VARARQSHAPQRVTERKRAPDRKVDAEWRDLQLGAPPIVVGAFYARNPEIRSVACLPFTRWEG